MIGWIIRETDVYLIFLCKFKQSLHKLSATTVILRPIIQIDDEHLDLNKTLFHALPPLDQSVNEAVAGDFGCHPIQKKLIGCGKENADRRHGSLDFKIMISRFCQDTAFPSSCKRTNFDDCLRIYRKT